MSVLQEGFREIGRKFRRLALGRRIKAAGRVRADALRALGRRAVEAGITGAASEGLLAGLAETEARDKQLGSQLNSLDEQRQALEQKRDADVARFDAQDKEVMTRKSPVDAELAAQQKAVGRNQSETDDLRRRLAQAHQERQSLELVLRRPQAERDAGFDRTKAEVRVTALLAEQRELEANHARLAEAAVALVAEVEKLKAAIAPLQAELDRIDAERKLAAESAKRALADLRKQSDQVHADAAGVSRQRDMHFEELGGVLAAAKPDAPALAAERSAVETAEQAQAALQDRYDGLLSDSQTMSRGTMPKFAALMATAALAIGGAAYAATKAIQAKQPQPQRQSQPRARVKVEDCSIDTVDRRPVSADPGGPYEVERGGKAELDGSKSKGVCLKYTWTFAAAPKDSADSPGHGAPYSPEAAAVFPIVDKLACPEGTSGNPGASKRGVRAPTNFLCSLKVTLTVTDGNSTDSKDVVVKVKPRGPSGWQTSIDQNQAESVIPASSLATNHLLFGDNTCALGDTGGHALHAGGSWQGEGYSLTSIKDPRGPFDEWWYVADSKLRIKRAVQINQDLTPNSELHKLNIARGYPDIDTMRTCVLEHERLHGKLIFEKMQKIVQQGDDPARMIETLSAAKEDKDELVKSADMAVGVAESLLYPQPGTPEYIQNHVEIKARLVRIAQCNRGGKILLPNADGKYGPYPVPNFATAGENGE
jgi:hypothetical protein